MSKRPAPGGGDLPAKRPKMEVVASAAPVKRVSILDTPPPTQVVTTVVSGGMVGPDLPQELRPAIPMVSEVPYPKGYVPTRGQATASVAQPQVAASSWAAEQYASGLVPMPGSGPRPGTVSSGKTHVRAAAGESWVDPTLSYWKEDDFRIFVGDLGNECSDEVLRQAFAKARVIRDKKTNETKGYGFVSFGESADFIRAMREMQGKYIGNRPVKLRKSKWQAREAQASETK